MTTLRVWLLILLAVLLPLRGALAQALPCVQGQGHAAHVHAVASAHSAHDPASHAHTHAASDAFTPDASHAHVQDEVHGKCSVCAACCTGVPLAFSLPSAAPPALQPVRLKFSSPASAVTSVVLAGLERPPRAL